jgi:hypothetical protein
MAIGPALGALTATLERAHESLVRWLAPGSSAEEIAAALRPLGVPVAGEVREYFTWRSGLRPDRDVECELFPDAVPLALTEAVAAYRQQSAIASRIAERTGVAASSVWNVGWFPLFQTAGGDYYVTVAVGGDAVHAPIELVTREDRSAPMPAYDSLTSLVETVTACFDAGVYTVVDGAVHEDRVRASEIIRRLNPARVRQATGWV